MVKKRVNKIPYSIFKAEIKINNKFKNNKKNVASLI